MVRPTITQEERNGDVRVCASLDGPPGGIADPVEVEFTSSSGNNALI